jgi:hypothetical protein
MGTRIVGDLAGSPAIKSRKESARRSPSAGVLHSIKRTPKRRIFLVAAVRAGQVEPLLPIEKKLIGWSLGLGIGLLIVLIAVNHFFPIKL